MMLFPVTFEYAPIIPIAIGVWAVKLIVLFATVVLSPPNCSNAYTLYPVPVIVLLIILLFVTLPVPGV